ncbi:hypothetical protein BDQ12DRAFT_682354 [Crucibulum laeve]|uniref:RING-type domain-containing protein n=1 Tax=Crucibulum laeve TaxID=68775 RepID=A0A5C3M3Q1_9AGAR|nr:hypothetical protein BDQ12DRAFT_682354 [Crucibulum laeve]
MAEVIEIDSSPEPDPMPISRRVRFKSKSKGPAVQSIPVLEITDSDSDDFEAVGSDSDILVSPVKTGRRPIALSSSYAGPSRARVTNTLQLNVRASSSSLENIPSKDKENGKAAAAKLPLFLPGDEENEPPPSNINGRPEPALPSADTDLTVATPTPPMDIGQDLLANELIDVDEIVTPSELDSDTYLAQVLEIVPDVSPAHALTLIEELLPEHKADVLEQVLHRLFEDTNYPKVDKKGKKRKSDVGVSEDNDETERKKIKLDYSSTEREYKGGKDYDELALIQLQTDFPFIPKPYLRRMLLQHNHLYAPTHLFLAAQKANSPNPLPFSLKTTAFKPSVGKGKHRQLEDDEFSAELAFIRAQQEKDIQKHDEELAQQINQEEYEENGDGIECSCCFDTCPIEKMVQCPEAHLFCSSCITTYASTQLGSHSANLVCMHQSSCKQPFPPSELRRVLPEKLMDLYERVKQQKEIEQAGLEGLEECPFCEWKCVMEAGKDQEKLFRCRNEECGVVSCRSCKKPDHIPKSCQEVEDDKKLDGRHTIEEAMTRALMRNCPKCEKPFIKEAGCNKMICPNCNTMSCYVCRKVITGYDHFHQSHVPATGQAGPSTNGNCLLWDPVEQRHAKEVQEAAEKALAQYKLEHPDIDEKDIEVDVPVVPPVPVPQAHQMHAYPHAFGFGALAPVPQVQYLRDAQHIAQLQAEIPNIEQRIGVYNERIRMQEVRNAEATRREAQLERQLAMSQDVVARTTRQMTVQQREDRAAQHAAAVHTRSAQQRQQGLDALRRELQRERGRLQRVREQLRDLQQRQPAAAPAPMLPPPPVLFPFQHIPNAQVLTGPPPMRARVRRR